ncbi:MAG TPA: NADH-quinone oxidoreductase subunit L [Pyrinomonadaceae bacterium]|jgi:NADH-quinone oxidoreductase subunit L|nr:NADH-quinone oxidoreductase subunit L [Pyrinomonadaceae bacterium]
MHENNLLSLIIFAPLAGAAINWFLGRRLRSEALIGLVACGAVAVSTIVAFIVAFGPEGALRGEEPRVVLDQLWSWIAVENFRADFGLAMDRLSGIYTLFITFVGLLIHIFATGYMHGDKGFYRFFAYLNLFMFSMLTLVLADNLLLMFVGWEGVGLCSYLLIGYYTDRKEAGDAAKKAFIANRVGDWGVVLGIMLVFFLTGTISFFPKEGVESALQIINGMPVDPFTWRALFAGGITSAAILLFIGATGKSAQIPLFVWLPDAMAGPTPVSALIHAATMVTAGVYMIVRCSAIFVHAPTAMFIVAIIGALTALFAATIGLAQNDIKKVLAYSTISQLGYMMLACGVGAFVAAIFHVMTHAFFKALLFLGSGSVIHGMHHEQDMRRMGGLRKYMPITFATMLTGWLAICGIPIWAGFFSKDEILWKTWSAAGIGFESGFGKLLWVIGAITAGMTAVYMTRLMVMTFWGAERFRESHAGGQADEAHAHGYDEGEEQHDAHAASAGDRPHHEPGEHVSEGLSHHDEAQAQAQGAHDEHVVHEPHESPWVMTVPLIILAILSTVGGLVGIPYALSGGRVENYFEHTLEPVIAHAPENAEVAGAGEAGGHEGNRADAPRFLSPTPQPHDGASPLSVGEGAQNEPAAKRAHSAEEVRDERIFSAISVLIGLAGIALGWFLFQKRPLLKMPRLLENKYYVDEIYDATIINPIKVGSREGLWKLFDVSVIDGIVNGLGRSVAQIGAVVRYIQVGFVRSYAAIILLGALAVIGYFAYYSIK